MQREKGRAAAPAIVNEVLRSPGQPLHAEERAALGPRFGHDFGGVRIHADARARGKVFRSRDAGKTWERLLGGLPNGQRALFSALTIEARPDAYSLYVADTDGQVFESLDAGDSWTIIADVPPVSKGDFHKGLVRDRVKLANVDDIVANPIATRRWQQAGKEI
jgi:hypothetical protein